MKAEKSEPPFHLVSNSGPKKFIFWRFFKREFTTEHSLKKQFSQNVENSPPVPPPSPQEIIS
jgi:hypothetical protein